MTKISNSREASSMIPPYDFQMHMTKTQDGQYIFSITGTPRSVGEWKYMIRALQIQTELYQDFAHDKNQ